MPGSVFHILLPLNPPESARRILPFEHAQNAASQPAGGAK
jgi:hypothetical protein